MTFYTVRPISTPWTETTKASARRGRNTFSAAWSDTVDLLERELRLLRARDVIMEIDVRESDLRLDGGLRSSARVEFPGVRIRFKSKHGPLTYETDSCDYWQHNVRSIALGLQALRAVDRYGITKRAEQYAGWRALPPGSEATASHMTTDEAWAILGSFGDGSGTVAGQRDAGDPRPQLRRARAFAHPDRHGGDRTLWDQVEEAGRVLGVDR